MEEEKKVDSLEEDVQALIALGLTKAQATVYLTIADLGQTKAKTIQVHSMVARQDIYRILAELAEIGLVEKILKKPNEFRSIPILDGINILVQRRQKIDSEIHRKTTKLMLRYKHKNLESELQRKDFQYTFIQGEAIILRTKEALENAQTHMDSIISLEKFLRLMVEAKEFRLEKAFKRGVKIRIITEKPEDNKSLPKIFQAFKKDPFFEVRYLLAAPQAHIGLFDKKEVFINSSVTGGLAETPLLWTDNPSLVAIVRDYFEIAWITALEI